MESLKKYFKLKPLELRGYRIMLMITIVFLPIWGYFLIRFVPDSIEYMSHRYFISALYTTLIVFSYFSKSVRNYFSLAVLVSNVFVTCWIAWITYVNKFSPEYVMGLIIVLVIINIFSRDRFELAIYWTLTIIITFTASFVGDAEVNIPVFILSMVIILSISSVEKLRRESSFHLMERLNDELQRRNYELEQFASIVSHDLKTPLFSINLFTNKIKSELKSEQGKAMKFSEHITGCTEDMKATIDDLLAYSKFSNRKILTEKIELHTLIAEVTLLVQNTNKGNELSLKIDSNVPKHINGNSAQIKRLFQNLIDNGVKYNRSQPKVISIKYRPSSHKHIFIVKDNGIGFPQEELDSAFLLHRRLHEDQEFSGTGLGLAISKRIVENHNGEIEISHTGADGSEVKFTLDRSFDSAAS